MSYSIERVVERTLDDIQGRLGVSLGIRRQAISQLMQREAEDLEGMANEPGFDGAVLRSRDIIAAEIGLSASGIADEVRFESLGLIFSALKVVAILIA